MALYCQYTQQVEVWEARLICFCTKSVRLNSIILIPAHAIANQIDRPMSVFWFFNVVNSTMLIIACNRGLDLFLLLIKYLSLNFKSVC